MRKNLTKLIFITIILILALLLLLQKPSNSVSIFSINKKIDSINNVNKQLLFIIDSNKKLRKKELEDIAMINKEKDSLNRIKNKLYLELRNIKNKNNKIPDDSVFIVLRIKYYEDSINSIVKPN